MGSVESVDYVDYVDYVSAAYRLPVGYDPTEDKNTSVRARIMPFAEAECSLFMGILLQSGSCCRRVSGQLIRLQNIAICRNGIWRNASRENVKVQNA